MLTPGQIVTLAIEKPAVGGRMLARADGAVVFVAGAIPGERVRARIDRVAKGVAYATAVEVVEASPDRRPPAGDPLCGGCLYAHIAYGRQLALKAAVVADALRRIGRVQLPDPVAVAPSPETGYRMRARLHLRSGAIGFFREGTHEVCDAGQTGQLLPATVDVLERLAAALRSLGLQDVQEVELAEIRDASGRVVHLERPAPIDARMVDRLADIEGLTGLSLPQAARGAVHVVDTVTPDGCAPLSLQRHVLAFFQGNRYMLDPFVSYVLGQVPRGGEVLDLYAGVGLFAAAVAACRDARVTAVEGDRVAASDLAANAREGARGVVAVHQAVEAFVTDARLRPRWSTIIVDPPRTGLSKEALDGVVAIGAPGLVYVSCDVATLARDARRLVESGYAVGSAAAFDLFPNTAHVETVVRFEKVSG
jgi:23S rRNA (uracil1939-C5)-methyltransferase